VLAAVDLDDQRCFNASKVGDAAADRQLAAELEPAGLPRP